MSKAVSPQQKFIESARAHGKGTVEGDALTTNKAYKNLIIALRELRETPDRGDAFLATLLQDSDPSVATWAALHLLPTKSDQAIFTLQNVTKTAPSLIALGAEMTLREWQAGRLVVE